MTLGTFLCRSPAAGEARLSPQATQAAEVSACFTDFSCSASSHRLPLGVPRRCKERGRASRACRHEQLPSGLATFPQLSPHLGKSLLPLSSSSIPLGWTPSCCLPSATALWRACASHSKQTHTSQIRGKRLYYPMGFS